ncbi:outer membrane protein assembly factor BamC [Marinobacter sp. VGCF2001]|uniref:outer membrane protein assembly factor BamC n=1 Tax=Marinobacter sp. VGCF2001 TaxID=3417189 RepID=UPI003CF40634
MQVPARARKKTVVFSRPAVALVLSSALAGCSLIDDRSEDYVNAPEGTPIQVPEGLDDQRLSETMPIRAIRTDDARSLYPSSIPRPPDMTSEILDENYVIEELDGRIWLLVNEVPGRLWPVVSGWMNESGLGIAYDSPQLGVLQSELANFSKRSRQLLGLDDSPSAGEPKVVLQARLAPGIRRKTTEIRVRALELEQAPGELMPWDSAAAPKMATEQQQRALLAELSEFLKQREDSKSFSRAASGMVSEPLVRLLSEQDEAVAIRMELDFGRTWAEVNRSLEEMPLTVMDLNRSEGWLQVDFRTEDERSPGWFSWFADEEEPVHTHTIRIERGDGAMRVIAGQQGSYNGERSAADLLTRLFERLY